MENKQDLQSIADQVKNVDNDITRVIIPVLKSTIENGNLHNKRLFLMNMVLLVILFNVIVVSITLFYKQNIRYNELIKKIEKPYIQERGVDVDE